MRSIAKQPVLQLVFCVFAVFALVDCSKKKSKSQEVDVTIAPEKPIVITADATINGKKVAAPWFQFYVSLKNNSEENVTIIAVEAEITGQGASGQLTTANVAWSAGSFDGPYNDLIDCNYNDFGTWAPGEERSVSLDGIFDECDGVAVFLVGSNPKSPNGNSFRYRVKLKPLGWFGTILDPSDRFERFKYFYTQ